MFGAVGVNGDLHDGGGVAGAAGVVGGAAEAGEEGVDRAAFVWGDDVFGATGAVSSRGRVGSGGGVGGYGVRVGGGGGGGCIRVA